MKGKGCAALGAGSREGGPVPPSRGPRRRSRSPRWGWEDAQTRGCPSLASNSILRPRPRRWGGAGRAERTSEAFCFPQTGAFKLCIFRASRIYPDEPLEGSVGLGGNMKACDIRNGSVFSCKANPSLHRGCYQRRASGFCGLAGAPGRLFQTVPRAGGGRTSMFHGLSAARVKVPCHSVASCRAQSKHFAPQVTTPVRSSEGKTIFKRWSRVASPAEEGFRAPCGSVCLCSKPERQLGEPGRPEEETAGSS